jgi:hypothetical protein
MSLGLRVPAGAFGRALRKTLPALMVFLILQAPSRTWAQSRRTFSGIGAALEAITQAFSVHTGFESATGDLDNEPVSLDLSNNDVTRVFREIIRQRPAYVWNLSDGFYDVYPKSKSDSVVQAIVPQYVVTDATLIQAAQAIGKLPTVQKWASHHHATTANLIGGSRLGAPPRMSFDFAKLSVCSILNRVYGSFGVTQWRIWRDGRSIVLFIPL